MVAKELNIILHAENSRLLEFSFGAESLFKLFNITELIQNK